jgi:hypothetical protein
MREETTARFEFRLCAAGLLKQGLTTLEYASSKSTTNLHTPLRRRPN